MPASPAFTDLTFTCESCQRVTRISTEALAVARAEVCEGETVTDEELSVSFSFCSECVGAALEGEHVG